MSGPLPTDDPNHIFPINDGIDPVGPSDVPSGFDLTALLSESMRARPPWRDMSASASRVMYGFVERLRLALQLCREPRVLARALKVATLKMCGMDWPSTLLRDEDYDRALEAVAQYEQEKGPSDFGRFLGYCIDVPMDLVPLWSRDYVSFMPGPPIDSGGTLHDRGGTVYSSPPGTAYPTSHCDLVYELFSPRGSLVAAATTELTRQFYQTAPIHLVLDAIAPEISLSVGTLYLVPGVYVKAELNPVVIGATPGVLTPAGAAMGSNLQVDGIVISSDTAPVGSGTTMDNIVYTATTDQIATGVVGAALRTEMVLGVDVGTFVVGTIGLTHNGTLVGVANSPGAPTKRAASPPIYPGSVSHFAIDLTMA